MLAFLKCPEFTAWSLNTSFILGKRSQHILSQYQTVMLSSNLKQFYNSAVIKHLYFVCYLFVTPGLLAWFYSLRQELIHVDPFGRQWKTTGWHSSLCSLTHRSHWREMSSKTFLLWTGVMKAATTDRLKRTPSLLGNVYSTAFRVGCNIINVFSFIMLV